MNVNEDHFDPKTVAVMHQIANLLFVSRELRSVALQFENSLVVDKSVGNADASFVLKFCRTAGTDLLKALFGKTAKREELVKDVKDSFREDLEQAIVSARKLVDLERIDLQHSGANGNHISKHVLAVLVSLRDTWYPEVSTT